jgi:hypothetical protein
MSANVTYRLDTSALAAILTGPDSGTFRELRRRGNRVLSSAVRRCPVDEGRLRGSLTLEMRQTTGGVPVARIGSNLEYAIYVHEGTGIHAGKGYIYPKAGKFLVWPVKNNSGQGRRRYKGGKTAKYAFAKRVQGVKGRPFLRDALQDL